MKATWFAVVLLSSVLSLPVQAVVTKVAGVASAEQKKEKINLNQADAAALSHAYHGIGKKRAQAIVAYRKEHGLFKSLDDLALVRGIGKSFVKKHAVKLHEVFVL